MRLIHCSDIHLDSKLETNLSPARARQRNAELCRTFERMVEYAKENAVRAILISGDLFDAQRTKNTTVQFVLQVMKEAKEIDFLYLRGNHDHRGLTACSPLPANLKLFSDRWCYYRYGDVIIAGLEITSENCTDLYSRLSLRPDDKNIVMLHGQIASSPDKESIVLSKLTGKNADYLALGHLHQYQTGRLDYRGTYCYSGCLEGRGFDECGEKGFVLLDTDGFGIRHSFVAFAHRTVHSLEVDITDCRSSPSILSSIRQATAHIPSKDLVKITLTGTCPQQTQKNVPFLEDMLSTAFYCIKIEDTSKLHVETSAVEKDVSLKSEFIRSVLRDGSLSEEDVEDVLQLGLAALRGEELNL